MRRCLALVMLPACLTLTGCLNWQGSYDQAARFQCDDLIDAGERLACFDSVSENSWQKRRDARAEADASADNKAAEPGG